MRTVHHILVVAAVFGASLVPLLCSAADFPGASGMALVESDLAVSRFLVAQDFKPWTDGDRLGILSLYTPEGRSSYVGVPADWEGAGVERPSDLEALCAIPGSPDEFLASESGYYGGKYGRVFHLRLVRNLPGSRTAEDAAQAGTPPPAGDPIGWRVDVLKVVQLPQLNAEIEGIGAVSARDGRLLLLLGERGGTPAYAEAWLRWCWLDLGAGTLEMTTEGTLGVQVNWPIPNCSPWARGISDIHVDGGGYVWLAGASDSGDLGPFRSIIYRAGRINADEMYPYFYDFNQELIWELDGVKVEALAAPCLAGSVLSFATDDELYGGIFRQLPPAAPRQQPFPYPYYGNY